MIWDEESGLIVVKKQKCNRCGQLGLAHYIRDREGDQKYLEIVHPTENNHKRKVCYIGNPNSSSPSYPEIFRSIYKDIGKLLIGDKLTVSDIQKIISKYKPYTDRKLPRRITKDEEINGVDKKELGKIV